MSKEDLLGKIKTSKGEMDLALLEQREGEIDNDVEKTSHVEHWFGGKKGCEHTFNMNAPRNADGCHVCLKCGAELVHRSVTMKLKKAAVWADPAVASFK